MNRLPLAALLAATAALAKAPAVDLGRVQSEQVTATISLKLRNQDQLQSAVRAVYDRSSPQFHKFLSADEFRAKFAPTQATIDRATQALQAQGLAVELVDGAYLSVTGASADVERAFGVQLHKFQQGKTQFHAPVGATQVPAAIAAYVDAVAGLDSRPRFHPHVKKLAVNGRIAHPQTKAPNTPDAPGLWTVLDLADYYDINPLYAQGITGKGKTIGIVTLAAFTPSDAFAYWDALGLKVNKNRLTVVTIGKGPGAPSDDSGSDETTLDVEQSGGIAPGAKLIVYEAANTDAGFIKAWAKAIGDNQADAISCSWGEWEEFLVQGTAVSDPQAAGQLQAYHNLFIQAALQGQSLSAAAGDAGSYDADGTLAPDAQNEPLSVDHPASDSFMLAAGGTTLPGPQDFTLDDGSTFTVNVAHERAWSWDYLNGLCKKLGLDPVSCGIFPAGGGGGVSVVFPIPPWQDGLDGTAVSEPKQSLIDETTGQTLVKLPSRFPGRNLPDISLNADPDTGYLVPYTSDVDGFSVQSFWGGTSFVAPQLAGITALINQSSGGRVGLLSFALYDLAWTGNAYSGKHAPIRDITFGDNEFYNAGPGYDQATGLGVLDVANFAKLFQ